MMKITMQVGNQDRLDYWLKLADKSPQLAKLLSWCDGWATVNERFFRNRPRPTLSWDELYAKDPFGTARRFLVECWAHGDVLTEQIEKTRQAELEAIEKRRNQA